MIQRRLSRIRGVIYSVSSFLNGKTHMTLYYSLVDTHINQSFNINGASESYQTRSCFCKQDSSYNFTC